MPSPDTLELVARCDTCDTTVDTDRFPIVPEDPEGWAHAHEAVIGALHGHPVAVSWTLTSSGPEDAPARPRLGLIPRLGALDG